MNPKSFFKKYNEWAYTFIYASFINPIATKQKLFLKV